MLEASVLSLIVGLIRKGNFRCFTEVEIKGLYWLLASPVLLLPTIIWANQGIELFVRIGPTVFLISQILILIGLYHNRKSAGVLVIFSGLLLNILVMAANGGSMPVNAELLVDLGMGDLTDQLSDPRFIEHTLANENTRFYLLGDVIGFSWPYPRVLSIGDALMIVGLFVMIQGIMVPKKGEG